VDLRGGLLFFEKYIVQRLSAFRCQGRISYYGNSGIPAAILGGEKPLGLLSGGFFEVHTFTRWRNRDYHQSMGLGSTEVICPNCNTVCRTKGVTALGIVIIVVATIITFGIGLIVGLIYLFHVAKRPTECSNCGAKF